MRVERLENLTVDQYLDSVKEVISPEEPACGILIISGGCCYAQLKNEEAKLEQNLVEALNGVAGLKANVKLIALSEAKKIMDSLDGGITSRISSLIDKHGSLSALPFILINGAIAFFGGVPTAEQIRRKIEGS